MAKVCKFPDKKCLIDCYYYQHSKGDRKMCRLSEWKEKIGVCPYDKGIQSRTRLPKGQKLLI